MKIRLTKEQINSMTLDDLAALPVRTVGTAITAHFLEVDRFSVTLMGRQKTLPMPPDQYYFSGNRFHVVKDSILALFRYRAS